MTSNRDHTWWMHQSKWMSLVSWNDNVGVKHCCFSVFLLLFFLFFVIIMNVLRLQDWSCPRRNNYTLRPSCFVRTMVLYYVIVLSDVDHAISSAYSYSPSGDEVNWLLTPLVSRGRLWLAHLPRQKMFNCLCTVNDRSRCSVAPTATGFSFRWAIKEWGNYGQVVREDTRHDGSAQENTPLSVNMSFFAHQNTSQH